MRDLGVTPAPMSAYLLNLGLESLHVRMKRHSDSALAIAKHLEQHEKISWVNFPALESSKDYALTQKYLPQGTCGVVSFGVKGGRAAAAAFMEKLQIVAIETHVADARSCCLHPATTTHRQLSDAELFACGVAPDLVRLSVGLEDAEDLIADIDQALDSIQ
jgi:O-acetylhomoserine (thiol)-lyase